MQRLENLEKRLSKAKQYSDTIKRYVELGHVTKLGTRESPANNSMLFQRCLLVDMTSSISTLEFTTLKNVESTLCISPLIWKTLHNVKTTLSFSTTNFTTLVNVESTLWKCPFRKRTKNKSFQVEYTAFKV